MYSFVINQSPGCPNWVCMSSGFFPGSDIHKPITNVFTTAAGANGLQNSFPCLFFFLHHYKVTQQITKVTMSFKCELWGPFLLTPPCMHASVAELTFFEGTPMN